MVQNNKPSAKPKPKPEQGAAVILPFPKKPKQSPRRVVANWTVIAIVGFLVTFWWETISWAARLFQ